MARRKGSINFSSDVKKLTTRQQTDLRAKTMMRVGKLIPRLADCAEGNIEMTMPQLKAAEMLLNRTVPTLAAVQIVEDKDTENLSREEIEARIKQKLEDNPILGVMAGITPTTIDGTATEVDDDE